MRDWGLTLDLDPTSDTPLFLQLARAITGAIRTGRLRPGESLPSTRYLANALGVGRNTVKAAYLEMQAEGWIVARHGSGTRVSRSIPQRQGTPAPNPPSPIEPLYPLDPYPLRARWRGLPGMMRLLPSPDLRLFPLTEFARAHRWQLKRHGTLLLDHSEPRGHPLLRRALLAMLAKTRGIAASEDEILITHGGQMAMHLIARILGARESPIAVEELFASQIVHTLRLAGAQIVPLPLDEHGVRVDSLRVLLGRTRLRAALLTPHHQRPTGATLPANRRMEILELARAHAVALIEDDYDHEFHYDGRPVLPLASLDRGTVIYVGTLSKLLTPGLRLGYVIAPKSTIEALLDVKHLLELADSLLVQAVIADLFEDGTLQRAAYRARRVYMHRRDVLSELLHDKLGDILQFAIPRGGMGLWCRVAPEVDILAWNERARGEGVLFTPGEVFTVERRSIPYIQLGFSQLAPDELREAVERLVRALAFPGVRKPRARYNKRSRPRT